jgi:hypothetical protein
VADNDDHIARLAGGHGPDDDDGYCCRDGCYARSDRPWRYAGICPVTHDEAEGLDQRHDRDTGRTEIARLSALVDEQAAEIEAGRTREAALAERLTRQSEAHAAENERLERRRAFWAWAARRLYRKGLAAAKDHRGWYERAVTAEDEIERLRGEVEAGAKRADDAEQARDYETYYHARAKKKIGRLEGQAAAAESRGAERERAAVVAYLRGWNERMGGAESPAALADEIEAGLHRREGSDG